MRSHRAGRQNNQSEGNFSASCNVASGTGVGHHVWSLMLDQSTLAEVCEQLREIGVELPADTLDGWQICGNAWSGYERCLIWCLTLTNAEDQQIQLIWKGEHKH